jgi:hypothetical protein
MLLRTLFIKFGNVTLYFFISGEKITDILELYSMNRVVLCWLISKLCYWIFTVSRDATLPTFRNFDHTGSQTSFQKEWIVYKSSAYSLLLLSRNIRRFGRPK